MNRIGPYDINNSVSCFKGLALEQIDECTQVLYGLSGSGKSLLMQAWIMHLLAKGVKVFVFDFGNGYCRLKKLITGYDATGKVLAQNDSGQSFNVFAPLNQGYHDKEQTEVERDGLAMIKLLEKHPDTFIVMDESLYFPATIRRALLKLPNQKILVDQRPNDVKI